MHFSVSFDAFSVSFDDRFSLSLFQHRGMVTGYRNQYRVNHSEIASQLSFHDHLHREKLLSGSHRCEAVLIDRGDGSRDACRPVQLDTKRRRRKGKQSY